MKKPDSAAGALARIFSGWPPSVTTSSRIFRRVSTTEVSGADGQPDYRAVPDEVWTRVEAGEPPGLYRGPVKLHDGRVVPGILYPREMAETGGVLSRILIQSGRVLSVFGKKPVVIKAANATIGIRGTGAYVEVDPGKVYFCLCYGEADLDGPGMSAPKRIKTTHHESPLVITDRGGVMVADPAGVVNHTDDELVMLEALVGREPPFTPGAYPSLR